MKFTQATLIASAIVFVQPLALSTGAQMHHVDKPEQVTRAVGVYEYVGDLQHPKAARLTPVSLFISGHFEDAGVYLARPIPFALDTGLRYDLQISGVRQDYLDVVASRDFAGSASAGTTPFDDGWVGYGRVVPPAPPKTAKVRANCGSAAHVVQESSAKDDSRPHFGTKPADEDSAKPHTGRNGTPDPCLEDDEDRPEKVSLADDKRDANSPDPERPTLHRSPESTAHNTGSQGKPDKKAPKPPPATITANSGPADDPDRPMIRHRATDEDDPNALPPDPIDLASREQAKALLSKATAADSSTVASKQAELGTTANDTVAEGGNITAGDITSGGPVLRRGRLTSPSPEKPSIAQANVPIKSASAMSVPKSPAVALPEPLESIVAVSDAKDRPAHDFTYHFASVTERATALDTLQTMARAVIANPALATDAPEGATAAVAKPAPAAPKSAASTQRGTSHRTQTGTVHTKARAPQASAAQPLTLADEQLSAYQLYFSAPITYTYSACVPENGTVPERFVTVIAQTDAEGKLQPAMRSVTDTVHLDRIPRYRLIDAVDADGSNRASLLMELRAQRTRQFALYRLLGNRPDQIFVTGSTLL